MLKRRNYSKDIILTPKTTNTKINNKQSYLQLINNHFKNQKSNISNNKENQNINKKIPNNSLIKLPNPNQNHDTKYGLLNKKIKEIIDTNQNKQNKQSSMTKSLIHKKTDTYTIKNDTHITKQILKNQSLLIDNRNNQQFIDKNMSHQNLYFLQNLKRKNSQTTQFYINIHTSILTFKQFLRIAQQSKPKPIDKLIPPQKQNRKTIVFDMDQTLIHTNETMTQGFQLKVPFKAIQGKISTGYVNVRPYAKEIIIKLSQFFDIIVFTAGNKCYADPILDHIDPNGIIQHRLYRQSCVFVAGQIFVKDLRILGRKLQNVILVDNAPYSYMMQLGNGVPILNYFKGKQDNQLYYLQKYLMGLLDVPDVRTVNSEYFKLHQYIRYDTHQKLIQALYSKKL